MFNKIVADRRGRFCFEPDGLFASLLEDWVSALFDHFGITPDGELGTPAAAAWPYGNLLTVQVPVGSLGEKS